jgi:hypothetical protein
MSFALPLALLFFVLGGEFSPAHSYVGPGVAITMLSSLWAVLVAVILALGGILVWPIRALLSRFRAAKSKISSNDT